MRKVYDMRKEVALYSRYSTDRHSLNRNMASVHFSSRNGYFVIYLSTVIRQFGIPSPTPIIGNKSINI